MHATSPNMELSLLNPHELKRRRGSVHMSRRRFSELRRESARDARTMDATIRRPSLATLADRGTWRSPWEILFSCVGLSVGIGNVWRFPYLAYQYGGGAFIISYLVLLVLVGVPMYFLELAVGQFSGAGPLTLWNCCPIAKGVGCAMITVSLIVCIYYNVIMSYTVFYVVVSFAPTVPWGTCDPAWADMETCYIRDQNNAVNSTISNTTVSGNATKETASLQYWERRVLKLSSSIEYLRPVTNDIALCFLFSWIIVVLSVIYGLKTSGKVVYFAAFYPYVILFVLLVTGLSDEGAWLGVRYFLYPEWHKLLDIQVWQAAAGQMFFSLGVSMGGLIMYSSYSNFSNNVYRDALVVSVMDTVTSIISGIITFSILGAMANDVNVSISHVVKEGPGLAFIAYSEALLRLPVPQLWSVLFYLMLFILGLDSEFTLLENVLNSISDEFPIFRQHKISFCGWMAFVCYLMGLTCVTYGDNYVLTLMDVYGGSVAVLFITIAECIALLWVYGLENICRDLKFMLGFQPGFYWRVTWAYLTPVILGIIYVLSLIQYKPLRYEDYEYSDWADAIGWVLAGVYTLQIPVLAIVVVYRQKIDSLCKKIKEAARPTSEWGPAHPRNKERWLAMVGTRQNPPVII